MGTGGQHRDDRLGILGRLLGRADGQASFLLRAIERVLREIEGVHVMALFREIGRHPAAHVAEPDETDACHVFSPHLPSSPAGGECYFPVQFPGRFRSEEHTSELQSLMRISYAVFCLKKKITSQNTHQYITISKNKSNIQ